MLLNIVCTPQSNKIKNKLENFNLTIRNLKLIDTCTCIATTQRIKKTKQNTDMAVQGFDPRTLYGSLQHLTVWALISFAMPIASGETSETLHFNLVLPWRFGKRTKMSFQLRNMSSEVSSLKLCHSVHSWQCLETFLLENFKKFHFKSFFFFYAVSILSKLSLKV